MTILLQEAFEKASELPAAEQEVLAARLLAELGEEAEFDHAIAASGEKLANLARQALEEHRAGRTQKLDSDTL